MLIRILPFKIKNLILGIIVTFSLFAFKSKENLEKVSSKYSTDLVGYIGKAPIFMHLRINETDNGDVKYSGYYAYVKIGRKIELNGSWLMRPGTPTKIQLTESVKTKITGQFELLPASYGNYTSLEGVWFGNGKNLNVNLKQIN